MTREIVAGDVDYALQLLEAGCAGSSVVACLCWRGVEEAKARELVSDLLKGKTPACARVRAWTPRVWQPPVPRHRSRRRFRKGKNRRPPCRGYAPTLRNRWKHFRHLIPGKPFDWIGAALACLGVACLLYVTPYFLEYVRDRSPASESASGGASYGGSSAASVPRKNSVSGSSTATYPGNWPRPTQPETHSGPGDPGLLPAPK